MRAVVDTERTGQRTFGKTKHGRDPVLVQHNDHNDDEQRPLLSRSLPEDVATEHNDDQTQDFSHLPWCRRPSIGWIVFPYLVMALSFGGIVAPKLNLIIKLVCRQHLIDRGHPVEHFSLRDLNGLDTDLDKLCRDPEVSKKVSLFMLVSDLLTGLFSAIVSPRLGSMSDVHGRKPIFITCSLGFLASEIITLVAACHQDTMDVKWLLISPVLEGLTGSAILAMAMVNTYATDCVPASRRSTAFGFFHGCTYIGLALGPILAGYVVKQSGSISSVFWLMVIVHVCCVLFILFFVPESISKRRRDIALRKAAKAKEVDRQTASWLKRLRLANLVEPLSILYPTGRDSSPGLRRNLVVLAAVDTIMFGVAMGSVNVLLIYVEHQFGWSIFESSRYLTIVSSTRMAFLFAILPAITYSLRDRQMRHTTINKGCDAFDLNVMRVGIFFETCGWIGYSLTRRGDTFTLAGVISATGSISSPALQSALTKHVPPEQTGQLLGANGLLHALTQIVAPVVFNSVFAATVGTFPQTVFICLAFTFGAAFAISWLIQPNIYYSVNESGVPSPESATDET